jgi:hypothetical protein
MPLYLRSVATQGMCPNSLSFCCFHLRLTFEFIKELGSASMKMTSIPFHMGSRVMKSMETLSHGLFGIDRSLYSPYFFCRWILCFGILHILSRACKQPRLQDFLTQMKTRVCLIPNLDHETRKTIIRTRHVRNKIPTRFYCKEKTK